MSTKSIVEKYLGQSQGKQQDNDLYFCPKCQWKNPRLSVDYDNNQFHCWYCHWGSKSLSTILYELKADQSDIQEYKQIVGEAYNLKKSQVSITSLKDNLEQKLFKNNNEEYIKIVTIPDGFFPIRSFIKHPMYSRAVDYLNIRGVSTYEICLYDIHYNPQQNHLLFPSYSKTGNLNFYVIRSASTVNKWYEKCKSVKSSKIVFYENMLNFKMPITITEGIFDAIKVGFNTVPILGTYISKGLIENIVINQTPKVTIYLDSDALSSSIKYALYLKKYIEDIYIVLPTEYKDAGSMSRNQITDLLNSENVVKLTNDVVLKYNLFKNQLV